MALTIEDGSIVANADSFATVAQLQAYATARGLELPATDAEKEILLRNAADYLNGLESRFKGTRVEASQALCWPRENVYLFNSTTVFADDEIPALLIAAQCQLAYDSILNELQPVGSGQEVTKEKIDVIEVEYNPNGNGSVIPEFNKAMSILDPLFKSGGGFTLRTVRA